MRTLKDLLARIPIPGLKEAHERAQAASCIESVCGVSVSADAIVIDEGVATLRVPPVLKSALLIRKAQLMQILEREGVPVRDIR